MWPFNKLKSCEHEWHKLGQREEFVYEHNGGMIDGYNEIFVYAGCLKCTAKKKFTEFEWQITDEHQKARLKWRLDNGRD